MEEYMGRFGKLKECAAVRNYQEMIYYSKKIYDLSLKYKTMKMSGEDE